MVMIRVEQPKIVLPQRHVICDFLLFISFKQSIVPLMQRSEI